MCATCKPHGASRPAHSLPRRSDAMPASMYFKANTALGPPYHVLVDTNFINFSIQNKIDIKQGLMDCLLADAFPCITDCVMAELEKLGPMMT